jgi:hypothetical protein
MLVLLLLALLVALIGYYMLARKKTPKLPPADEPQQIVAEKLVEKSGRSYFYIPDGSMPEPKLAAELQAPAPSAVHHGHQHRKSRGSGHRSRDPSQPRHRRHRHSSTQRRLNTL